MATIEESLVELLTDDVTVNTLIAGRMYPLAMPQGERMPAVVYQRISGPRVQAHDGPSGLAHPRFQFACIAATYAAAKTLANALRVAIDGYQDTIGSVKVDAILVENEIDLYNYESSELATSYTVLVDAIVWHHE